MDATTTGNALLDAVTTALGTIIDWVGTVIQSVIATDGALNPLLLLFAIGIGISVLLFGIRAIKSVVWGA